ncbi:MAG TPA: cation:proton antiporter, partial [Acetivibrio sp.]|nr:cation:proton antiporter [Acetivibrio sp.]
TKIQIASLLGVMTVGFILTEKLPDIGRRLSDKLNKIWIFAEILLFVLVGAEVNVGVALKAGKIGVILIIIGLIGRSIGVIISLSHTDYNLKEKLFCVISYIPKATVQAAMGAVPLSFGVESGDVILAIAVLSILITAPLGAIGIHYSAEKLLIKK